MGNKIDRDDHEIPLEVGEEFANRSRLIMIITLLIFTMTRNMRIKVNADATAGTECIFSKLRQKAATTLIGFSLRLHTSCCNRLFEFVFVSLFV